MNFLLELPPNRVRRNYRGGALLDALAGNAVAGDGDRPEDWIASTVTARNPGLAPVPDEGLATVMLAGRTQPVKELFARHPEHFLGRRHVMALGNELGFLLKLLDSAMRLHVQAHPTAEFAQQRLNSRWGKLEAYVILGIRSGCAGAIRLGFQRPPGPVEWRRIVLEQDLPAMDACFDDIPVAVGEVWIVPGGLPHAIGAGLLVMEIMEPTDLVVRCEFTREGIVVPPEARFMQRDPDFALRIFDQTPLSADQARSRCRITPQLERELPGLREFMLIGPAQTGCFEVHQVRAGRPGILDKPEQIQVGVIAGGSGRIRVGSETLAVQRGSRFLAAAAAPKIEYQPDPGVELEALITMPGDNTRTSN